MAATTPPATRAPRALKVLFYGQLIPLHGIATIVEAARLLRDEPIDWLLVGRGQDSALLAGLLAREPLPRVRWIEWIEYGDLLAHIADADLALGIFGTSDKAASVIPNKVFQVLAAGRPLVTRDSPAVRELLVHAPPWVQLVPPGDAASLAAAILAVAHGERAVEDAGAAARPPFDAAAIGGQLLDILSPSTTLRRP